MTPRERRLLNIAAAALVLLLVVCVAPFVVQLPLYLLVAWVFYLIRVVPQVQPNWSAIVSAVLSLGGVLFLGQISAAWLWRPSTSTGTAAPRPWKFRWTFAGAAIVVLMFTCGIAAIGVTHQTAW